MELEKQRLLLNCIVSSRDLMALCNGIIKPSYFDPTLKKTVKFVQDYYTKYRDIPQLATIRAEAGAILEPVGEVSKSDIAYVSTELETFCRNRAAMEAVIAGPELIAKGDFGALIESMKVATSVGLHKDAGLNYFLNPEERLKQTLVDEKKYSIGWPDVDAGLGGGLGRQELLILAAESGGGKSMTMLNIGRNLLKQKLNGVYISLEMSEGSVSKRLDSMISKVAQENLLKEMDKVLVEIENSRETMGTFIIKRMAENRTNINDIRSYLLQLEQSIGFKPDFIIIDYIDILGCTHNISLDNLFIKDKYVTEEIRSLGFDFNAMMISASQLNRTAVGQDSFNHSHIQGGISKIQTADYVVGIKQDDLMRASGEIWLELMKTRNSGSKGLRILLGWDPISLCINTLRKKGEGLDLVKKSKSTILGTDGTIFSKRKDDGILTLMNT